MSPIDIVPVDHNHTDELYIDETVMSSGVIENKNVYSNEDIPSREASLSSKPLINHIKPQRRTVVSYFASHIAVNTIIIDIYC